jgi:hypothetical protein
MSLMLALRGPPSPAQSLSSNRRRGRFQGGIRLVAPLAHPDQRAGVLSVLFTVSYLGLGIPAVAAGLAIVRGGLVATSYEYGLAVILLASFAAVNLIRLASHNSPISTTTAPPQKEFSR